MEPYLELHAHYIGKSHLQNGLACEDYSATYSDESVSVVVISDGHGDKNCFRSAKGAQLACEIAIHACRQFQSITSHIDYINHCDFESLVLSLESDIADTWKENVLSDAQDHPFTNDELLTASDQAQEAYRNGLRLEKAYGCTLIFAMSTKAYWLAVQIGDGKCVAAYKDGVFVEPVPTDENCLGNHSTSLCNSNAKDSFRHYYSNIKPCAVFVSSDGVEESFDQAGLYNCFYSIAYWIKEAGIEEAKGKLSDLLPQISEGGSGDDVSLATMVSQTDLIGKPRSSLEQVYEKVDACANAERQYKVQLANIQDRITEKRKDEQTTAKEIIDIEHKLAELKAHHEQLEQEISNLQKSAETAEDAVKRASEQMERAEKYRVSAETFWHPVLKKLSLYAEKKQENDTEAETVADQNPQPAQPSEPRVIEEKLPATEESTQEISDAAVSQKTRNESILSAHDEKATSKQIEETSKMADIEDSAQKKKKRFWFNKN